MYSDTSLLFLYPVSYYDTFVFASDTSVMDLNCILTDSVLYSDFRYIWIVFWQIRYCILIHLNCILTDPLLYSDTSELYSHILIFSLSCNNRMHWLYQNVLWYSLQFSICPGAHNEVCCKWRKCFSQGEARKYQSYFSTRLCLFAIEINYVLTVNCSSWFDKYHPEYGGKIIISLISVNMLLRGSYIHNIENTRAAWWGISYLTNHLQLSSRWTICSPNTPWTWLERWLNDFLISLTFAALKNQKNFDIDIE